MSMSTESFTRRLRGAAGNALVWGAAFAASSLAVFAGLKLAGALPASMIWLDSLLLAVRFGVIGGIAGGAFSSVIGFVYRGKRLSELHWVRFGLGGAAVTGVFVPLFLQTMNVLSGDGMVPMEHVLDDALWTAVFGGVAAGLSLKLAQMGDPRLSAARGDPLLGDGAAFVPEDARDPSRAGAPARRGFGVRGGR
jgi:hypothetical protein